MTAIVFQVASLGCLLEQAPPPLEGLTGLTRSGWQVTRVRAGIRRELGVRLEYKLQALLPPAPLIHCT